MFGYVKPFVPSLTVAEYTYYKSVYCGLCHTAGGTSGAASRLFLSYDFVFLALVRQALQGQAVVMTKRRCVAHPLRRRYAVQENEALRYAAAAAAVLRAYKLQDDLFDEHGLRRCVAQLLRLCNRRAARRGAAWVCPEALQAAFADLRAIEQAQTASMDAPADVFGVLLGELFAMGLPQRQARIAADHICGISSAYKGCIGSSCIRVFGLNAASTGLNERSAAAAGIAFDSVLVFPTDKVGLMPGSNYLAFKLLFAVPSGKLLGAQAIGAGEADKRVNMIAALLSMNANLSDLINMEHCYAPLFSTAKDAVHMAALVAENLLTGRMRQVHVDQVRGLVESGAYIVDVRNPDEYAAGHIIGAHNIPLPELRQRLDEIPRDIPVYLHCRSSQRSYYAYRCLVGNGYDNVVNISGSFLGISLYEYFTDRQTGRKPIVTDYNFA